MAELIVLAGAFWYLNKTLGHTERDQDYVRNADTPMCPKCFYNVQRQNLPDAGNSQVYETTWFEPSSVPEIRKQITKSIFEGNRRMLAHENYNSAIVTRQLQVRGDPNTHIGRIPITFSPWIMRNIKDGYIPKVLSLYPQQSPYNL